MRGLSILLTAFIVVTLAYWAYTENYQTRETQQDVRKIQQEIADEREAISVLRAEWAYLNRPDRLRELSDLNFEELGLVPMSGGQFAEIKDVNEPIEDLVISAPVEVQNGGEAE